VDRRENALFARRARVRTTSAENIDALAVLPGGDLLISTTGSPTVSGPAGLADADIIGSRRRAWVRRRRAGGRTTLTAAMRA
jgi:hypothetical protein